MTWQRIDSIIGAPYAEQLREAMLVTLLRAASRFADFFGWQRDGPKLYSLRAVASSVA
jgi:hypothetical protein